MTKENKQLMYDELIQVIAMGIRFIQDLIDKFKSGKVLP